MNHPKEVELFKPTDEELISSCLLNKVMGRTLPAEMARVVGECDLYGGEEPWEIRERCGGGQPDGSSPSCLYFFTQLKKKSLKSSRFSRRVGAAGKWEGETVAKRVGKLGLKKMLSYEGKNGSRPHHYHWVMHEYSLDFDAIQEAIPEQTKRYVVCRITRKPNQEKKKRRKCKSLLQHELTTDADTMEVERDDVTVPQHSQQPTTTSPIECSPKHVANAQRHDIPRDSQANTMEVEMDDVTVSRPQQPATSDPIECSLVDIENAQRLDDIPKDSPAAADGDGNIEWMKLFAQQLLQIARPEDLQEEVALCFPSLPIIDYNEILSSF